MVVSNIFYFHPYLGKISNLTNISQMGWFNHQLGILVNTIKIVDFPWLCWFQGGYSLQAPKSEKSNKEVVEERFFHSPGSPNHCFNGC